MPTTKELFDSLSSFDGGKVAPPGKPDKGMSLKEKFRSLHQWQPTSSPPQPDMPIATPTPDVSMPRPLPLYSVFEPSAVGEATKNLLRGFLHSVENTGQVLREGRTSEQAQAFERMTPEEKALYRESGRGLQSPFSQPLEEMQPQNQALMEAAMLGTLLGKPLPAPGLPIRGLRPKSKIIPGEPYSITTEGFVESMKRPPKLASPLPPVPPAKGSQKPATPPSVDEVAQNTANALRAERIGEQLTQAERIRQSPAGATLLNRDLARQQAEGQLRGLSSEAFSPPEPPPPPPLPPARGPKALPPTPPLAVTPQGQVVPRMARVRGTEATPENLVPAESSVVGTPRPPDPLITRLGKTRVDTIFRGRLTRAAELQKTGTPDFIAKNNLTLADESNRPFVNLIADLETRGKVTTGLVKDGKQTSLGPYQISAKVRRELNLSDTATLQEQTQAAERLVSRLRTQYGDDPQMVQLAYNNPARARFLAKQVGRTPPQPVETPIAPPPVVQAVPKTAKGAKAPAVPPPLEPPLAPDVSTRMRELQYEAEHASGQPYGKQYGSVETEMGPQSVAIGNAGSFQEQFAPLYPELRNLPKVGPKEIATAIQKDKNNKLYTIIKNEVSRQLENEKASPEAIGQRPSDFEVFSQAVDDLAAQEKASVKPPPAPQPKLIQTQAELPPTPLQPKAPQVEHGDLLAGFKKAELPPSELPFAAGGAGRGAEEIAAAEQAAGYSPLIQPRLRTKVSKEAITAVTDFMKNEGLTVDPEGPRLFIQLSEQIASGRVRPERLAKLFEQRGLNLQRDLTEALNESATESGRVLNIYSQAAKALETGPQTPARVKLRDMFYEVWLNGLVSAPSSQLANIAGNTLTKAVLTLERGVSAGLDLVTSTLTRTPRERFFGEVKADLFGSIQGFKLGIPRALRAFREGTVQGLTKVEYQPAIPGRTGHIVRTPTRTLGATDEFFKSVAEQAELSVLAFRTAKQSGLSGEAFSRRVGELMANPPKEWAKQIIKAGEYSTFNQSLGRFGQSLMEARNHHLLAKIIVPFMRTPSNIAKFTLARSPVGIAGPAREILAGRLKGGAASDALAAPVMGSLIGAGAAIMAAEGFITGGGPTSPQVRNLLRDSGWQPYAFHVGNRYIPFSRLEPVGSVMGMAADMVEISQTAPHQKLGEIATKISGSIAENLTSKTFLIGIENAFEAFSDPRRAGERFVKGLTGSIVPNIVGAGARALDPIVRETSPLTAPVSKIPGLSQSLPVKRSVFGEPVTRPGTAVERFISPAPSSFAKKDRDVEREAARLGLALRPPSEEVSVGYGAKVSRTTAEQARYQKESGQLAKAVLREALSWDGYWSLPEPIKRQVFQNALQRGRAAAGAAHPPAALLSGEGARALERALQPGTPTR